MIKNRKMDHIGLAVTDLDAAAAWYMDVLGFERIGTYRRFFRIGDVDYDADLMNLYL